MNWLLDLLFPKFCVGCRREGEWLCQKCEAKLYQPSLDRCPDCSEDTGDGRYCDTHKTAHDLDGLVAASAYQRGTILNAIHALKYDSIRELALPLGRMLALALTASPHLGKATIIPVPLHAARQRERGFNQAELLVAQLVRERSPPLLKRHGVRSPQARLSHFERQANIAGAFSLLPGAKQHIDGQTFLLVDDVSTTGATLDEIARLLKTAGATAVWGLVVAKG